MCVLQPEGTYHIYNHATGDEQLFREEQNYLYFLKRYADFIHPIAHTYAYCLMPDHFHVLIRIRKEEELKANLQGFKNLEGLQRKISQQFSNLFNSYTKSYNKFYERKGALFCHNFKRKPILNEDHFTAVIYYIHRNPVHHGFCDFTEEWFWSSYHTYLNNKQTLLEKEETLERFGGKDEFIKMHHTLGEHHLQLAEEDFY